MKFSSLKVLFDRPIKTGREGRLPTLNQRVYVSIETHAVYVMP